MIAVRMLQPLVVQGLLSEQSMWLWRDLRSQAAELCHFIIESSAQLLLDGPCSPCLQKKCTNPFCMLQIGIQEVYEAVLHQLCKSEKFALKSLRKLS